MYDRARVDSQAELYRRLTDRRLESRARALGVTETELIRRGLDQSLAVGVVRGPNPAAWAAIERFIRRNASTMRDYLIDGAGQR
jgi:hypothetical protein